MKVKLQQCDVDSDGNVEELLVCHTLIETRARLYQVLDEELTVFV